MQALHQSEPGNDLRNLLLGTRNFLRVQSVCADAMNNSKLVGLIGEPGYGKTTALNHFADTHENVFICTVRPSMSAKDFWVKLYEIVPGVRERYDMHSTRPIYYCLNRLIENLSRIPNSLVIIDECGKLSCRMLEYVHELRDQSSDTTGIILAGPNYFHSNLLKWARAGKIGMPEVLRRINYFDHLLPPDRSEVKSFCSHYGITDADIVKDLLIQAKDFGTLHNLLREHVSSLKANKSL